MQSGNGRQGAGVRAPAIVPIRSILPKGELANIAPGVEGMTACNQLTNAVREETRQTKNNISSPHGAVKLVLDKVAPESIHAGLIKELLGASELELDEAGRGECINGMHLTEPMERVIASNLPPHIQESVFLSKVVKTLGETMPDKYRLQNSEMASQVSSRGLKVPPHAHLRASSSGNWREQEGSSEDDLLNRLARQQERADGGLRSFMRASDLQEQVLRAGLGDAELQLQAAGEAVAAAQAAVNDHAPPQAGDGQAQAAQQALQGLQQALTAATATRTAARQAVEGAQTSLDQHITTSLAETTDRLGNVNRISKSLEDYKKLQAGNMGGPVKLEEIVYTGEHGEEQAIFLPALKILIIFKCIVCVPTPAQIQAIMTSPKQGVQLFAREQVTAAEDIQQFGARLKNYVLAAQLVGTPLDGTTLLVLGLKDPEIRRRVSAALDAVNGPVTIDDVIRKATDVNQKQQSTQLLPTMRGMYGGRGAMAAGVLTGGDEQEAGGAEAPQGSGVTDRDRCTHGSSEGAAERQRCWLQAGLQVWQQQQQQWHRRGQQGRSPTWREQQQQGPRDDWRQAVAGRRQSQVLHVRQVALRRVLPRARGLWSPAQPPAGVLWQGSW
jgi:hypothetical protein